MTFGSHRAFRCQGMRELINWRAQRDQNRPSYLPGTRVQSTTVPHGSTFPLPLGVNCDGTVAKLSYSCIASTSFASMSSISNSRAQTPSTQMSGPHLGREWLYAGKGSPNLPLMNLTRRTQRLLWT